MKKIVISVIALILSIWLFSFSLFDKRKPSDHIVHEYSILCKELENSLDSLALLAMHFSSADSTSVSNIKAQLHQCKLNYKKTEIFTEYFFPSTAEGLNGPLVNEADEEEGTQNVILPEGLQVIQNLLYNENILGREVEFKLEVDRAYNYSKRLSHLSTTLTVSDWQIFDAAKLEVIRIFVLAFAGYDSPNTEHTITENIEALKSISFFLEFYKGTNTSADKFLNKVTDKINSSVKYLVSNANYDNLNRYDLIKNYMNIIFESIEKGKQSLEIVAPDLNQPLKLNATNFWTTSSYDLTYYSRYDKGEIYNKEMVELGRVLFFDPILSDDLEISCASCHQPDKSFTDGVTQSIGLNNKPLLRNAPTLLNVGFQGAYFYDSRAGTLEDQIRFVVQNPEEVHGDLKNASKIISTSTEYKKLFRDAFNGTRDTVVSTSSIIRAISSFERNLFSFESKFDKDVRGEEKHLTKKEINGFNLFMGKALCGTCHFPPVFNGNLPPNFLKTETEVIGVPFTANRLKPVLDTDMGRGGANGMVLNNHGFKTPGLRNIQLTGPYMHNGVFNSLEEVIDFYNVGGGVGWGFELDNQTLPFDSLELTKNEKEDLVLFLKTLSDPIKIDVPTVLPYFENEPLLNSRKVFGSN